MLLNLNYSSESTENTAETTYSMFYRIKLFLKKKNIKRTKEESTKQKFFKIMTRLKKDIAL